MLEIQYVQLECMEASAFFVLAGHRSIACIHVLLASQRCYIGLFGPRTQHWCSTAFIFPQTLTPDMVIITRKFNSNLTMHSFTMANANGIS
jgi:hypothetical protein